MTHPFPISRLWIPLSLTMALAGCSGSNDEGAIGDDAGEDTSVVSPGKDASASDAGNSHDSSVPGKDGSSAQDAAEGDDASSAGDSSQPADGSIADTGVADTGTDAGPVVGGSFTTPGADTTVVAFDKTLVCFGSGGAGPCSRTVDSQVTFPATGTFSKITMHLTLDCPSNGCDPWDRVGSIYMVQAGSNGGNDTLIELGRFMTPYGIKAGTNSPPAWDIDVSELRPLLAGKVTLRVFIDTWVPQGNAAQYGGGWVVGTTFNMKGGTPAKSPIYVTPIWAWSTTGKEPTQVVYGDARWPINTSVPPKTLTLPNGPKSWGIRSTITGHGQANLDNCAEFCSKNHTWKVGSGVNTKAMWRTDCASFPSSGTYQYSRAGWCPGADVAPWDIDITSQVTLGAQTTIAYDVQAYTNTCNGDAPNGGICTGCASGESCGYNGGSHTQPFYYVSSLLIGFR